MNLNKMFEMTRGSLGDTLTPYRNTDQDLVNGLTACIEYLWFNRKDLFLDDNLRIVNDYSGAFCRANTKAYSEGDIVFVNDPIDFYQCVSAGTSGTDTEFNTEFVIDGTASFVIFSFPECINLLAVSHFVAYYCLMLDGDEQANENLAQIHYNSFITGI